MAWLSLPGMRPGQMVETLRRVDVRRLIRTRGVSVFCELASCNCSWVSDVYVCSRCNTVNERATTAFWDAIESPEFNEVLARELRKRHAA